MVVARGQGVLPDDGRPAGERRARSRERNGEKSLTDVTSTLTIRQTEPNRFEVIIPEIGTTVTGATFGSATLEAHRTIEKHHHVRFLGAGHA
jgi:hypothetical protein